VDQRLHDLHLRAGEMSGREKTCGKKTPYPSETLARKAAEAHNRWKDRRRNVEPYPCAYCQQWHIGGTMPVQLLEAMVASSVGSAEQQPGEPAALGDSGN
jgi:hypothetical protein